MKIKVAAGVKFSPREMKTIATKVYRLRKPELTDAQCGRIDWKRLTLCIDRAPRRTRLINRHQINVDDTCTEWRFAYHVFALLNWRAELKHVWDTGDTAFSDHEWSNNKLSEKKKPVRKPIERTDDQELTHQYRLAERAVLRTKARIERAKSDVRKANAKLDRAESAHELAKDKLAGLKAKLADRTPTNLDNEGFATRMRAKRNAQKKNAPAAR